jgi:transposase
MILEAYHDQHSTVEQGFRWIKNPAAIAPVWLEKPERIAALAMLTVLGLLVYTLIQRQVCLYLHTHSQQLPGNKGPTAIPTATVVLTLFSPVMMVHVHQGTRAVYQMYGVHADHLMVCDALGLDHAWYTAPLARKIVKRARNP